MTTNSAKNTDHDQKQHEKGNDKHSLQVLPSVEEKIAAEQDKFISELTLKLHSQVDKILTDTKKEILKLEEDARKLRDTDMRKFEIEAINNTALNISSTGIEKVADSIKDIVTKTEKTFSNSLNAILSTTMQQHFVTERDTLIESFNGRFKEVAHHLTEITKSTQMPFGSILEEVLTNSPAVEIAERMRESIQEVSNEITDTAHNSLNKYEEIVQEVKSEISSMQASCFEISHVWQSKTIGNYQQLINKPSVENIIQHQRSLYLDSYEAMLKFSSVMFNIGHKLSNKVTSETHKK